MLLVNGKAYPTVDSEERAQARSRDPKSEAMKIVCCVDGHSIAQRCWDLSVRLSRDGDSVEALHVIDTDKDATGKLNTIGTREVMSNYKTLASKAAELQPQAEFLATSTPKKGSTTNTILGYTEEGCMLQGEQAPADVLVMGSIELADPSKDLYLGSVVAAVAKKTEANILVMKHFA